MPTARCCAGYRVIEARNGSEQANMQVVFGTQCIDEIIRLDVDTDGDYLDTGRHSRYNQSSGGMRPQKRMVGQHD